MASVTAAKSGPFLRSTPKPAPLSMPAQDFAKGRAPKSLPDDARGARAILLTLTVALTVAAAGVMVGLVAPDGFSPLDIVALTLFTGLFAWTAFGFVSAAGGFVVLWGQRPARKAQPQPVILRRTALLMPVYNEDPGRILAAVQALHEALDERGVGPLYDLFILSDTRDEAIAREEAVGILRLHDRLGPDARVHYRRRELNTDRKAGNIAGWVTRHGGDYDFMLILDADSLMSAETVIKLTAAMEADPRLGLLQTSPSLINAETLFARLQQFAARAYGTMCAAGQDWWSGPEGNYWGHNAIIRTRAFAEAAGLPHLAGRRPFGGHILSHDFVEAALLRRAGWSVRMDPTLDGSFEEAPPTILDMARRDRRWCQGNLQHVGVLGAKGLHWVSRLHMARGVLSYVASPLWLLMLLAGAGAWVQQRAFLPPEALKPATWLFAVTLALLVLPKMLSGLLLLRHGQARDYGGWARLTISVALETIAAALVAPVLMLMQSVAVVEVLLGRDAGWNVQQRDAGRLTRKEAWRMHRGHMVIGLFGAAAALLLDKAIFWWTSPVYLGLLLSAPLSALLARPELGLACRRLGLFLIPEERQVPPVAARAAELRALYDAEANTRIEIERLLRGPVHAYAPTPQAVRPVDPMAIAAE
jgi:membrane glycosyltransferase